MFDVITIGTITRDVFLRSPLFKVLKDPEHLQRLGFVDGVAECFAFGGKTEVSDPIFTIGGGSANTAVSFARQGLKTGVLGTVGKDFNGDAAIAALEAEKVSSLVLHSKHPTGYSTILLSPSGERTILVSRGASQELTISPATLKSLKAKWVYVVPGAIAKGSIEKAIRHFKKNGSRVAINLSGHYAKFGTASLQAILSLADVVLVNRSEAALLLGASIDTPEKVLLSKMARSIHGLSVITDGSKGCFVGDGSYMYHAGIFPERELVDRTGAGDAFGSGFVSALIDKESFSSQVIEQAIRAGSANATSVVEYVGAWEGLLTERTLKQNKRWAHLVVRKVLL